jgi:hypothetical protein
MTVTSVTVEAGADARPPGDPTWARGVEFVVRSLQSRLGTAVDLDLIRAEVEAEFAEYSEARIREFIPVLVEARVRARLVRLVR